MESLKPRTPARPGDKPPASSQNKADLFSARTGSAVMPGTQSTTSSTPQPWEIRFTSSNLDYPNRAMRMQPWNFVFVIGFIVYVTIRGVFKQRTKKNEKA